MAWIGVDVGDMDAGECTRWAAHVRGAGGTRVADVLDRMARVLSGCAAGVAGADRMLEVESRAARAVERMRADAAAHAGEMMGRAMAAGADAEAVRKATGADGWRDGSAAGNKNGGVAARRRKYPDGHAACGPDGGVAAMAERGKPALTPASTVGRDRRYGETWEGWAGVELRKQGFKMTHVAKALGMDVTEAWRHVSGWTKHWRREGLAGRAWPGAPAGWSARLDEARARALNVGVKGQRVVLNGTGDCGIGAANDGKEVGDV